CFREISMKAIRYVLTFFVLAVLAGLTAAQDVNTDYDKNVVFERYHTYSWGKVQTSNPLWQSRIEDAVDKSLSEKGWQKVQSGGDVVVAAVGATQNQQNYKIGTLVVDMYDASNKHLIWRGAASETLSKDPEHNEKNLDKAVDKMFKKFPPKK